MTSQALRSYSHRPLTSICSHPRRLPRQSAGLAYRLRDPRPDGCPAALPHEIPSRPGRAIGEIPVGRDPVQADAHIRLSHDLPERRDPAPRPPRSCATVESDQYAAEICGRETVAGRWRAGSECYSAYGGDLSALRLEHDLLRLQVRRRDRSCPPYERERKS